MSRVYVKYLQKSKVQEIGRDAFAVKSNEYINSESGEGAMKDIFGLVIQLSHPAG